MLSKRRCICRPEPTPRHTSVSSSHLSLWLHTYPSPQASPCGHPRVTANLTDPSGTHRPSPAALRVLTTPPFAHRPSCLGYNLGAIGPSHGVPETPAGSGWGVKGRELIVKDKKINTEFSDSPFPYVPFQPIGKYPK